jgi:hypothetical protein
MRQINQAKQSEDIMPAPKGNQFAKGNPGGGRPTVYKPEFCSIAQKMCELGATDDDLAEAFEVSERTIRTWMVTHVEFSAACRIGKQAADDVVERRFYERAVGYSREAVKIFLPAGAAEPIYAPYREHVPADVAAAKFWLMNRQPEKWREKTEIRHSGGELASLLAGLKPRVIEPKD